MCSKRAIRWRYYTQPLTLAELASNFGWRTGRAPERGPNVGVYDEAARGLFCLRFHKGLKRYASLTVFLPDQIARPNNMPGEG